ncbi:MAG TPA: CHASE3 domain-containing protein [Terriglobales bacterium]|nr:CHASE3 domain-containing protein [Terriglobales bacterium]
MNTKTEYSTRQVAWAAFILAVALLALIGVLAYRATNRLVASEQLVSHTREIQTLLEDIRSDVLQASNARRGYIITGLEGDLAGYSSSSQDLPVKLQRLQSITADNVSQQQRCKALRQLITEELTLIQDSVNEHRSSPRDRVRQMEITRIGSSKIGEVFAAIGEMESVEDGLLRKRRTEANQNYRHTITVLTLASIVAMFLIFINFYHLNHELRERERAERLASERAQLINAFFSSSTVGFAIVDSQLRCQRVNDILAKMAGATSDTLPGTPLARLFGDQAELMQSLLREVIHSGEAALDRTISLHLSGSAEICHWTLNCFPLRDGRGQVTRLGCILLDVTARRNAESAYRRLSSRLLRLQDEERRRIAREMHDSLGQYLTALKINLEVAGTSPEEQRAELFAECVQLANSCLTETRTLSHLLHPPLLDEAGLGSAARWYVTGFAERSGIKVSLDIPSEFERLPLPVETALFRVLQESLTNIHRHSHSPAADIQLHVCDGHVNLAIRDYGQGIPAHILQRFHQSGTTGVGLAGMRERIYELGGQLEIRAEAQGTTVSATIPISANSAQNTSAAESAA